MKGDSLWPVALERGPQLRPTLSQVFIASKVMILGGVKRLWHVWHFKKFSELSNFWSYFCLCGWVYVCPWALVPKAVGPMVKSLLVMLFVPLCCFSQASIQSTDHLSARIRTSSRYYRARYIAESNRKMHVICGQWSNLLLFLFVANCGWEETNGSAGIGGWSCCM